MAEDWKVGDLALMVKAGPKICDSGLCNHIGSACPPVGSINEVLDVSPTVLAGGQECGCLELHFGNDKFAADWRCIKVTPEEEDEFDRETLLLEKKAAKKKVAKV